MEVGGTGLESDCVTSDVVANYGEWHCAGGTECGTDIGGPRVLELELGYVVARWPGLSREVQRRIVAMVRKGV